MKTEGTDVLFNYLKEILFGKNTSMLSEEAASPEYVKMVQGLNLLHQWISENTQFAEDIALGNLNGTEPSRDNPLCDSLKMLRSSLAHLVWQTKQIAGGDYSQKVAMLGDFSEAFNTMTQQLKQREAALLEQNALLSCITDNIGEYVVVLDGETKEFLYGNKAFMDMAAGENETAEMLKQYLEEYNPDESLHFWEKNFRVPDASEQVVYFQINTFFIDWQGRRAAAHLLRDITEQKIWESTIEYAANSDALTGLYNRRFCMNTIEKYIDSGTAFGVCYADLDELKYVNDNYGHSNGDKYILMTAEVLKESFRKEDIICRIGGDEFVIIMPGSSYSYMEMRMKQARSRLKQIALSGSYKFPMSISYGVVNYDGVSGGNAEEILENADGRMYEFKQKHKK